jgi:hypothetical protein
MPMVIVEWGMRGAHFRDPEGALETMKIFKVRVC